MVPSTTRCARRPSFTIWARISGLKYGLDSAMARLFLRVQWDVGDQLVDHGLGRLALRLGVVVQNDAVPEHGLGQRLDVIDINFRTTIERRPRLGDGDQRLSATRTDAPEHPI